MRESTRDIHLILSLFSAVIIIIFLFICTFLPQWFRSPRHVALQCGHFWICVETIQTEFNYYSLNCSTGLDSTRPGLPALSHAARTRRRLKKVKRKYACDHDFVADDDDRARHAAHTHTHTVIHGERESRQTEAHTQLVTHVLYRYTLRVF